MDFEFEVRYFTSKVNFLQGFCVFELCGKLVLRDMFCLMCFHIARVFSRPTCVSAERPAKCPLKNNLWIINFCSNDCYHLFAKKNGGMLAFQLENIWPRSCKLQISETEAAEVLTSGCLIRFSFIRLDDKRSIRFGCSLAWAIVMAVEKSNGVLLTPNWLRIKRNVPQIDVWNCIFHSFRSLANCNLSFWRVLTASCSKAFRSSSFCML